jgi:soluble lytic murein transglycosylase-like protein
MSVESAFNPHATNLEGSGVNPSAGLMQVRFSTAQALGYPGELGNSDLLSGLYAPGVNVPLAAKLIRENLDRAGGDLDRAISAYNGGWNAAKGFGYRLPGGTFGNQTYVNKVRACYAAYAGDFGGGEPVTGPAPGVGTGTAGGASPVALVGIALAALAAFLYWLRQQL